MGELSESLLNSTRVRTTLGCRIAQVLDEIEKDDRFDDKDRKALIQCIMDPDYSHHSIARVMGENGYRVDPKSVQRHRQHGESCRRRKHPVWS